MKNNMDIDIKSIKILLMVIVAFFIVAALQYLKSIFIPLVLAVMVSFIFSPMQRFLKKKKIPKFIIIILTISLIFFIFYGLGILIYSGVSSFSDKFPAYERHFIQSSESFFDRINIPLPNVKEYFKSKFNWINVIQNFSLPGFLRNAMGNFADFFIKLLLTLVFLVFVLDEKDRLLTRIEDSIDSDDKIHTTRMILNIEKQIQTYLFNKTLISLLTAISGIIVMIIFKIDFIIVAGLLLFFLNFIPNFGSFVASGFPIMVYAFKHGIDFNLFLITGLFFLIQVFFGTFLDPKLQGFRLKMSPLIILISLIFWGWLWGPIGMVLAVPLTAAINIILKEYYSKNIISIILDV